MKKNKAWDGPIIWIVGTWDDIKLCFTDCNCGSRIMLTTRNTEVAEYASR
ncbi:hypothetical protein P3S67_008042 [Capsicum chacoense]